MAYKSPEVDEELEQEEEEPGKKKDKKKKRERQSLSQVLNAMNKKYGEGSLIQGRGAIIPVDVWPSGLPSLDLALGCGGIPRGRVIELFGQESSGKTTLTLALTAQCQQSDFPIAHPVNGTPFDASTVGTRKGVVAFVDAEHAFDPNWATNIGVDVEKLIFSQPSSGEEGLDIVSDLVDTGEVDLIIVDSVASLTPREELDGEISDYNIGAQARMMSKALRRLSAKCGEQKCTVIFINQMREKIGVMFGSPDTTPGGKALKFYASVRMQIAAGEPIDVSKKRIGRKTNINIKKNKVGPPFTKTEFNLMYGSGGIYGPDAVRSLVQAMCDAKLVAQNGSFYVYGDQKYNGFERFHAAISVDPQLQASMRAAFAAHMDSRRQTPLSELTDEEFLEEAAETDE